jgi:hypothetical protein
MADGASDGSGGGALRDMAAMVFLWPVMGAQALSLVLDVSSIVLQRLQEQRRSFIVLGVDGRQSPAGLVDSLAAELALRHYLPTGSVQLHRLNNSELLLVFPIEEDAVRVYNEGRPIHLPYVTLHCR